MYDISYPGIVNWYKTVFEKLGYMVLAHKHHHYDETHSYKICIINLLKAIEENMSMNNISSDRKHDYEVMYRNVKILYHHAKKDFHKKHENNSNKNNKKVEEVSE